MKFERFWEIYIQSFPESERRNKPQQIVLLEDPRYHVLPIIHEGNEAGFFTYWDLDGFLFGEHLAVDESFRNAGLGRIFLEQFFTTLKAPFIIEVERPINEIAARRIAFYERLGFVLCPFDYVQPSYTGLTEPVPMYMMAYQQVLDRNQFELYRSNIHKTVYKVPEIN